MAIIYVDKLLSLADEEIIIKITSLKPHQNVTIRATCRDEGGKFFHSYAFYQANELGCIDLTESDSKGGLYTGVEQMGLFWSMKNKVNMWLIHNNVSQPSKVYIHVYENHVSVFTDETQLLAFATLTRAYMSSHVKRIDIDEDGVSGTLFVSKSGERQPGIIDLSLPMRGLQETSGCLLVNHGFSVLCLTIYGTEHKPKSKDIADLDAVERAVRYLQNHNSVRKGGLGIIGLSHCAGVALAAASCIEELTSVVSVCGAAAIFGDGITKYKDRIWQNIHFDESKLMTVGGLVLRSGGYVYPEMALMPLHMPQYQFSKASILVIQGGGDVVIPWKNALERFRQLMQESGKSNFRINVYPGTGHLIRPGYKPLMEYVKATRGDADSCWCGGQPKSHAHGEKIAWEHIIEFFTDSLWNEVSKL